MRTGVLPEVRTGLLWLVGRQRSTDGAFAEAAASVAGAPGADASVATAPGADERALALWTTAALHVLDVWVTGVPAFDAARARAYEWLWRSVRSWRDQHARTLWLAASATVRREGAASHSAALPLAELALRLGDEPLDLTLSELAGLVTSLVEAGWPSTHMPVSRALAVLSKSQRADGALARGREDAVEGTLAGLRAVALVSAPG